MSYTSGGVDYNRAKIAAYIVVAGFLALMIVFGIRSATGPELQQGDRVESLACPLCAGTGEGKQPGKRCQACLGNKTLKAVVPGPKHPVDVRGTARSLAAFKGQAEAEEVAGVDAKSRKVILTPVRGAVAGVKVLFEGPGGRTEMTSKATGRYWGALSPGEYSVSLSAPGFASQSRKLTVKPRTRPIWPEAGGLEPDDSDTVHLDWFLTPAGQRPQ